MAKGPKGVKVDTAFESALICAERYSCGRRSYIVGSTAQYIRCVKALLSDWCIKVILQDLADAFLRNQVGDTMDALEWRRVVDDLTEEQKKRGRA